MTDLARVGEVGVWGDSQTLAESANSTTNIVEPKTLVQPEQKGHCVCGHPEALEVVHFRTRPCFYYIHRPKREWVGLTDADKQEAFDETQEASGGFWEFADYLEAKLKEKNT